METEQKLHFLKYLDTKNLIGKLAEYEGELHIALSEQADFSAKESDYTTSRGSDCQAVKAIIAELSVQAPETTETERSLTKAEKTVWLKEQQKLNPQFPGTIDDAPETAIVGKNLTENDKKAWLERQRKENKELSEAIAKQRQVAFLLDDWQIKVEMAKRRLEGTKAVLALKTAQIRFLSEGG